TTARSVQGGHALLHALLLRDVPATRHGGGVHPLPHPRRRCGSPEEARALRKRCGRGPAAHGQLGPRGRLDHTAGDPADHHRPAATSRESFPALHHLPGIPGDGGVAADRRCEHRRDPGSAPTCGRPGLPARRPRHPRHRFGGRVLRGERQDALGPGGARPQHRGRAHAGLPLVRRPLVEHPCPRRDPPGSGEEPSPTHPRHHSGTGPGLRACDRRAPGGLAHASGGLQRRPRGRPCPWTGSGGPCDGRCTRAPGNAGHEGRRRGTASVSVRSGRVCPYDWDVPGGVQQPVGDLAEELVAMGHSVSVLAPVEDTEAPLPEYLVPAGRPVPVPYNGSVARVSFGPRTAVRVRRWVTEGDFDVLHIHEPSAPSVSLLACWAAQGPVVATFHTSNPRSRAMTVGSTALRSALEKINAGIAVSEAARRTLVEHMGGDAVLIPNGVSVRSFAHAEPLPGWPGSGGSLGFLGRADEPRKGLATLTDAFALLAPGRPGLRLMIAGPGDPSAALESVPAPLRERVVVLGRLDDADKARAYHSADVFCAPNLGGESFG